MIGDHPLAASSRARRPLLKLPGKLEDLAAARPMMLTARGNDGESMVLYL